MTSRSVPSTRTLLCFVSLGMLTGGCNVDRLWSIGRLGQSPVVAHARTAASDADDVIDLSLVDAGEADLVEEVVKHRGAYERGLALLHEYYQEHGQSTKDAWVTFEMEGVQRVKQFMYLLDAEIPSDSLRPTESIAQADAMYERGLELVRQGGHGVPALYRQELMIQAARVFRDLIAQHPTSDKIDDAAFYCGEIHKEYLPNQETIAVKWYERAWTWNPETPHPARFQAAVVCDYRLHDRDRALELYKAVEERELAIKSNVRFATRRIHELTRDRRTAQAAGR